MQRTVHIDRCLHGRWPGCCLMLLLMVVLLPAPLLAGRGDKAGTAAAPQLLIPVSARAIALAGSTLATVSGLEAIEWNPSGLARGSGSGSALFSYSSYLADIGVEYVAAGFAVENVGRFGLSIKSLSIGTIDVTTEDQPDGNGETVTPTFLTGGLTFGRLISDRIAVGAAAKVVYEKMGNVSATGVAFDFGAQYHGLGGIDGLGVGVALKNIGPPMRYAGSGLLRTAGISDVEEAQTPVMIEAASSDLPSTIEIGATYAAQFSPGDVVNISAAFVNNNFSDDEYKFGAEYVYGGLVSLRGGYAFSGESEGGEYIFGPTFGMGLHSTVAGTSVSVDYAFRGVRYFGGTHIVTLTLDF